MKDSMGVGGSYGEPYNPERGDANSVVEEWVAVGRFMAKENEKAMRDFSAVYFFACDPEDFTHAELIERKFLEKCPA